MTYHMSHVYESSLEIQKPSLDLPYYHSKQYRSNIFHFPNETFIGFHWFVFDKPSRRQNENQTWSAPEESVFNFRHK